MTKEQIQALRSTLQQRLAELRASLDAEVADESHEHFRDIAGEVSDRGDESLGAEMTERENALIGHHVREVRELEAALARMANGSYGRCSDCEADIPYARLAAYPASLRCVGCEAAHERHPAA